MTMTHHKFLMMFIYVLELRIRRQKAMKVLDMIQKHMEIRNTQNM